MAALAGTLVTAGTAWATHLAIDTEGHTTLDQVLSPTNDPADGYTTLEVEDVDENYLVRDGAAEGSSGIPNARSGREARRRSLAYLAQMTDFQIADEESPARVEFLDKPFNQDGPASAWRPWEALVPFMTDLSVRQVNRFVPASPVPQGDGSASEMDLVLVTGDQADNQHRNETEWVREILEGGNTIDFNSGLTDPADYAEPETLSKPSCAAFLASKGGDADAAAAEGARYTGVQDYDDYPTDPGDADPLFYDPDDPRGSWADAGWPQYDGLLDRAQQITITPEGLDVPFYITNGNHDTLVQGNEDAITAFEEIATGCAKVLGSTLDPSTADSLEDLFDAPNQTMLVPPDPNRQFVSKPQIKEIYGAMANDDDHGFAFVDPDERDASNDSASYYGWDPPQVPGFRFISIDTVSEGGVLGPFGPMPTGSSDGNIDDPQFEWLKRELDAAQRAGKLIVIFGHHPVRSMDAAIPDEAAAACTVEDEHGHDVNPGCDLDPRGSEPIHLGDPATAEELGSSAKTFTELVAKYPNVITYVPGHTHENRVTFFENDDGGGWWEINTSAVTDFPQQHRLIEIMDNRDGTLSIFGTVLDHASQATAPTPCAVANCAGGFSAQELASIGRTLAFNDPQSGAAATAELEHPPQGNDEDQNVELLLADPRAASDGQPGPEPEGKPGTEPDGVGDGQSEAPGFRCHGKPATIVGSAGPDKIRGRRANDVIVALGGNDKVKTGRGRDVVCGRGGNDRINGGKGNDKLKGGKGNDRLRGGKGRDRLRAGQGNDRCDGGAGKDRSARGCEKSRRTRRS